MGLSNQTEVELLLSNYLEEMDLSQDEREAARNLGLELVGRLGLASRSSLTGHTMATIRCLLGRQEALTQTEQDILTGPLGLDSQPAVNNMPASFLCLGKGYSILQDDFKSAATIFKMTDVPLYDTGYGFSLPLGMELSPVLETRTYCQDFQAMKDYISHRLTLLGIPTNLEPNLFQPQSIKAGFYPRERKTEGDFLPPKELTMLYEKRLFRVVVKDPAQLELTAAFCTAVNQLPSAYNREDFANRSAFEEFFATWGHFVVGAAYGGGSLELKFNCSRSRKGEGTTADDEAAAELVLARTVEHFRCLITGGGSTSDSSSRKQEIVEPVQPGCQLVWQGGDIRWHAGSLDDIAAAAATGPHYCQQWEASLAKAPTILTTELRLLPVSRLADLVDKDRAHGCSTALADLLGGRWWEETEDAGAGPRL